MIIDEWLTAKLIGSTSITQYTTQVYPLFIPEGKCAPAIVYQNIGSEKNRLERNMVFSILSLHNSKGDAETLNEAVYSLFDNSTAQIRESSSTLYIDSVNIISNSVCLYENDNQHWVRALDISVWYH